MKKILIFILLCSLFWLAESQVSQKELVELFKNLHDYPKTGYTGTCTICTFRMTILIFFSHFEKS